MTEVGLFGIDRPPIVLLAVIASAFFVGFGGGVVFPILPNLGAVLGISAFMVGVILSANRWVRLVANAPAGALVDRHGTRKPFVIGLFVEGVATLGYVVALAMPAAESLHPLATSLPTLAAGPLAVGTEGWFAAIAVVVAYRYVPETHVTSDRSGDSIRPWDVDTAVPAVTVGLVTFGLMFAYIGALFSTLVLFLGANDISLYGLAPQGASGLFMAGTVLSAALFTFVGGRISDTRDSRTPILLTFLVVSFVGFLLLARAGSVVSLGLACVFIGAGQGGTSGPMMALLADLTPDERMGRASGTNNVLGDVGGGLGPMVSLPLTEAVGFAPVYAACAVLPPAAGAVLLLGVRRETGTFLPGRTAGETEPGDGSTPAEA